jgi:hypothetical protein
MESAMAETGAASEASRPRVFISCSREDAAFAGRLALVLSDRGFEAVIDREDVDAEGAWKARVRPLILSSDQLVVLLTAKSVALPSVRWEAELAASSGKRVVVVVPAPLEDGIDLPPPLSTSPWFHFYQHPTRADSGIHAGPALENALKADLGWRRQYTGLFLLAEKWKGNPAAVELLHGEGLAAGLKWRASIPQGQILVPVVAEFLDASEQAETRQVEPTGAFESRLLHIEERRAAAEKAARAKEAAAQAMRQEASTAAVRIPTAAPARTLTPTQLANLPLAPVHAPSSLRPSRSADNEASSPGNVSRNKGAPKREVARAKGKGLVAPVLIALLMFGGAGAVVWQVVPQYLASPMRTAAADAPPADAPISDGAQVSQANPATAEAPPIAPVEITEPAPPPQAAPSLAPSIAVAAEPAAPKPDARKPAGAEPTPAAAGPTSELADWRAARDVGNVAAFRTYMLKWPKGGHYDQALSAVRKRIESLSTKPESVVVLTSGPLVFRELPTFRDKGAPEGSAGQTVNFMDRIASSIEGEWLVLERDGAWPFRFVSARELESAKQ